MTLNERDPDRAQRIKTRREELRLSQPALARRVGNVSTKTIYNWEVRGVWMGWPHLEALARALRVSTDWLLSGEDASAAEPSDGPVQLADRQARRELAAVRQELSDLRESVEAQGRYLAGLEATLRELTDGSRALRQGVDELLARGSD